MSKSIAVCKVVIGVSAVVIAVSAGIALYRVYFQKESAQTFLMKETASPQSHQKQKKRVVT